ncbi:hypothetical protein C0Z17_25045 [Trinickia caryophylli]|nr:hypothetical protein C0Z17_25045 [Trinickia caryophylli]
MFRRAPSLSVGLSGQCVGYSLLALNPGSLAIGYLGAERESLPPWRRWISDSNSTPSDHV